MPNTLTDTASSQSSSGRSFTGARSHHQLDRQNEAGDDDPGRGTDDNPQLVFDVYGGAAAGRSSMSIMSARARME